VRMRRREIVERTEVRVALAVDLHVRLQALDRAALASTHTATVAEVHVSIADGL
jgi:hypothetical protein